MTTDVYTTRTMPDGSIWYYKNGELHREDGPAIEWHNGDSSWYINGKLHREDGPAVEKANGDKQWYLNGKRHREDGPAIESPNGDKQWWINDKLHRVGGPAIERVNDKHEWWIHGERIDVRIYINNILLSLKDLIAIKKSGAIEKMYIQSPIIYFKIR